MEKKFYFVRGNAEHPERVRAALEKRGAKMDYCTDFSYPERIYFISVKNEICWTFKNSTFGLMLQEYGEEIFPRPEDITERIKTFEDACKWCKDNDKQGLYEQYADAINVGLQRAKDIIAYLKLRIITCALNEGWKPTFEDGERRWYAWEITKRKVGIGCFNKDLNFTTGVKLIFKSEKLATYAATQFKDIYMDFCHKGKE